MTNPEVDELSARIDLDALESYRLAVGRRTRAAFAGLDALSLADPVDPGLADACIADGTAHPALSLEAVRCSWATRTHGWFLFLAGGHNLMHLGETITIRSRL